MMNLEIENQLFMEILVTVPEMAGVICFIAMIVVLCALPIFVMYAVDSGYKKDELL